ncbi:MAG: hypothetical protein RLZZ126_119 [Pseudomonadota bacterium]|jgi:acyl-CoA ligase (AMP-forming) (exosortase A-associated)
MTGPAHLLHELPMRAAQGSPASVALRFEGTDLGYATLVQRIQSAGQGLLGLGLQRGDRVAIFLEKRLEWVEAAFAAAAAGCVFVPINPVLKPAQVAHILRDCSARVLVTSGPRWCACEEALAGLDALVAIALVQTDPVPDNGVAQQTTSRLCVDWKQLRDSDPGLRPMHRVIDTDPVAIFYTSGSTGLPKGVVLSHRNMVAGAYSVVSYLGNRSDDVLLAALPLSFDAGFSQLTTAFAAAAKVVLINPVLPRDVVKALAREGITGLTAVPALYMQLAPLAWPESIGGHLRYFANTGGRMPGETLRQLQAKVPRAAPFLMYGLTEAFRSTYLPPSEVGRRPDSMGKAIPNAEVLVLRPDGSLCDADEPGELVHRGALVALGYWNDAEKTAERFRPLPPGLSQSPLPEIAVFSGDMVRRDADGFLYFVGRRDEMIKTSGYRVSPQEVEEVIFSSGDVEECAVFGLPHPVLGQVIRAVVKLHEGRADRLAHIQDHCRRQLPTYMWPAAFEVSDGPLPRNPNGKIDRQFLAASHAEGQSGHV